MQEDVRGVVEHHHHAGHAVVPGAREGGEREGEREREGEKGGEAVVVVALTVLALVFGGVVVAWRSWGDRTVFRAPAEIREENDGYGDDVVRKHLVEILSPDVNEQADKALEIKRRLDKYVGSISRPERITLRLHRAKP